MIPLLAFLGAFLLLAINAKLLCSIQIKSRFASKFTNLKYTFRLHATEDGSAISNGGETNSLLEQMRKTLGEKEDIFEDMATENKQLLQGLRDLDRDPNLKANNKLLEWLESNGVWVKTQSAWGRAPHPLVISSSTEDEGESCGRGLLAREPIAEGELLMTVPLDLCLTKTVAKEKLGADVILDDMDEYIAIALLLMVERNKGNRSLWKAYFDVLPDAGDVYPSFLWTEQELDQLRGSPTFFSSKSLISKLEKEYKTLQEKGVFELLSQSLNPTGPASSSTPIFGYELFLWSFVMLLSRAARLSNKLGGEELALVPYADLMNHNPYSNTYIDAQRSGMPLVSRSEEVAVYADRGYKKFEQVFINYGEKGNSDLLLLYGFALERNPFDAVDVSVGLSVDDPLYTQKLNYLNRSGRGAVSVRFPLQGDRYPSELIDFLRLLLVESEDLGMQTVDRVDFNEPISPSLERRVLTTLIGICESYLEQYPTSLQEDELLIADRSMFSLLSRQQRMAVKLRASEKRILKQTMRAVNDELLKLPKVVRSKDELVAAGRSFDALKSKSTGKSSTGNILDFVEIKGSTSQPDSRIDVGSKDTGFGALTKEDGKATASSIAERRRKRRSQ